VAHVGRNYPIYQPWRLYSGEAGTLAGFPPLECFISVQTVRILGVNYPGFFDDLCTRMPWSPGDTQIRYTSTQRTYGPWSLAVGTNGILLPNGRMRWDWSMRNAGVEQMDAGFNSVLNEHQWSPGEAHLYFTNIPYNATVQLLGIVNIRAKRWDEF